MFKNPMVLRITQERMDSKGGPGNEIRRIILLTRLRDKPKGMTMSQLVKDCSRVDGWSILGESLWDGVSSVLQSLIDDKLVASRSRFILTPNGREYLADPLKWRVEVETREEIEETMFWKNILSIFDKAYSKLRMPLKLVNNQTDRESN